MSHEHFIENLSVIISSKNSYGYTVGRYKKTIYHHSSQTSGIHTGKRHIQLSKLETSPVVFLLLRQQIREKLNHLHSVYEIYNVRFEAIFRFAVSYKNN